MPTLASLKIRPQRNQIEDYQHLTDLWNACEPDYLTTVEETRFDIENLAPSRAARIFFAELGGKVVGQVGFSCKHSKLEPHKFWLSLRVHPQYRNRGIGTELYAFAQTELRELRPEKLSCTVRASRPYALRFAQRCGFVEEARYWESRLDLSTFDPSPYGELEAKLDALGVTLHPLSDLRETTPDYRERIFDLDWTCTQDEPMPDPPLKPELEPWLKRHFEHPNFTPEAYLIAVDGNEWIGLSELSRSQDGDGLLYNGFTATLRGYRGKGVATALKVKNILWAMQNGYKEIRTSNNSLNGPMLAVNTKLGFKRQPAEIGLKKVMHD